MNGMRYNTQCVGGNNEICHFGLSHPPTPRVRPSLLKLCVCLIGMGTSPARGWSPVPLFSLDNALDLGEKGKNKEHVKCQNVTGAVADAFVAPPAPAVLCQCAFSVVDIAWRLCPDPSLSDDPLDSVTLGAQ